MGRHTFVGAKNLFLTWRVTSVQKLFSERRFYETLLENVISMWKRDGYSTSGNPFVFLSISQLKYYFHKRVGFHPSSWIKLRGYGHFCDKSEFFTVSPRLSGPIQTSYLVFSLSRPVDLGKWLIVWYFMKCLSTQFNLATCDKTVAENETLSMTTFVGIGVRSRA